MQKNSYDVVVVGGGAAGLTAGLYASRAGLKSILLERMMTGGQVMKRLGFVKKQTDSSDASDQEKE